MLFGLPTHVELLRVRPFCSPSLAGHERYSLVRSSGLRILFCFPCCAQGGVVVLSVVRHTLVVLYFSVDEVEF